MKLVTDARGYVRAIPTAILIHTSVKLVTIEHTAGLPCLKILIHTSVKLVTRSGLRSGNADAILIHTSVKLVTTGDP